MYLYSIIAYLVVACYSNYDAIQASMHDHVSDLIKIKFPYDNDVMNFQIPPPGYFRIISGGSTTRLPDIYEDCKERWQPSKIYHGCPRPSSKCRSVALLASST